MKHRYSAGTRLKAFVLCGLILTALFISVRHHTRDLLEVARTYANFHRYVYHHPEVLYHYSPSTISTPLQQNKTRPPVPKIIHQILLQENSPPSSLVKHAAAMASCQTLHRTWQHRLWTDESATALIATHYPTLLSHYTGYNQQIQRANILRYAILHHQGGVYLDLDITCKSPLDDLLDVPFLTPAAHPAGVNNAFILARPGHRFLGEVLGGVGSHDLKWGLPYVENMLSTGCMFFSNRWMGYLRGLECEGGEEKREGDEVFVLADERGGVEAHMLRGFEETPLFVHGGASSWHGWDAAGIVFVGEHLRGVIAVVVFSAVCSSFVVWKLKRRLGRHRYRENTGQEVLVKLVS